MECLPGGMNVTLCHNCSSDAGVFPEIFSKNLSCSFFIQKTTEKWVCTSWIKRYIVKKFVLIQVVFPEILSKLPPFVLFLDNKEVKRTV